MATPATDPPTIDGRGRSDTELRVAVIMTGGVSLAVWMGGVAAELLHLADRDGPYAELLAASGYDRVRVDVIAGTSAGGINGALLASATTWGVGAARFTQDLRQIWLEQGAFASLLRSPFERDPDALLRGESYLLPHLRGLLERWQPAPSERDQRRRRYLDPAEPPTRLLLTGTLLEPMVQVFVTADRPLAEPDHRGVFRFSGFDLLADQAPAQVARAARTSSSYPGAFEPSYLSLDGEVEDHLAGIANAGGYAIDGGVLVNRPFRLALDAVFGQRATRPVHRALLYAVPSAPSGQTEELDAPATEERPEPPSFAAVLGQTAALPMTQTIRDDLDALADHDRRWRHQQANRIGWIAALLPEQREHLAESLWPEFTRRRAEASANATLRGVVERNADLALERHWATVRAGIEAGRRQADWHGPSFAASLPEDTEPRWWWGVSSLEYLFQVVLDLVRVVPDPPAGWRQRLHDALDAVRAFQRLDALYWDAAFTGVDHDPADREAWEAWAADRYAQWPAVTAPSSPRASASLAACLSRIRGEADSLDAADAAEQDRPGQDQATSTDVPAELTQDDATDRLYTVAASIAAVVRDWLTAAEGSVVAAGQAGTSDQSDHLALADALRRGDGSEGAILRTLLSFWVIQATTQHDRLEREQSIDLVSITSDGAVTVDPRRRDRPSQKLTGGQLANFGGFAKRSWRANDFLWGRLDTAERIARWLAAEDAADAAARARQEAILDEELTHVAAAVRTSQAEGAHHPEAAERFLAAMEAQPPLAPAELLASNRIGEERLADERGSNAFVRTAATATAGATTILAGSRGGIGWVRGVARRARRFVVLPVYLVVQATRAGNTRGFVARLLALLGGVVRGLTQVLRRG